MDDLISRAAAIAKVKQLAEHGYEVIHWTGVKCMLENQPSVEATPAVHGRWVKMTGMMPPEYHGHYECSECQWHMRGLRNTWNREEELRYCPNCGAKMMEDDNG